MEVYICIKNFGKIKEARVNISHFTVFVGSNNSGKTQLMELIYAIVKHVSALGPDIVTPQIGDIDAFSIGDQEIRHLNEWVNEYLSRHIQKIIEDTFNAPIPIDEVSVEFLGNESSYEIYFLTDKTIEYLLVKGLINQEELMEMLLNKERYYNALVLKKTAQNVENFKSSTGFSNSIPIETARKDRKSVV